MNTRLCVPLRARADTVAMAAVRRRSLDAGDSALIPFCRLRGTLLCRQHLRDGRRVVLVRELVPGIDPRNGRSVLACVMMRNLMSWAGASA